MTTNVFLHLLDVSVDILLNTKSYGYEISWSLGENCTSGAAGSYGSHQEYPKSCSLPRGEYTLSCKDSYGDGWNGGRIKIQGQTYCEKFTQGTEMSVQLTIGGKINNIATSVKFANMS